MAGVREKSAMKKMSRFLFRLSFALTFAALGDSRADAPDAWLDYVESTGSQWIDTGVAGKSGTRMVAEMEWVAKPSVQSTLPERKPKSPISFAARSSASRAMGSGMESSSMIQAYR